LASPRSIVLSRAPRALLVLGLATVGVVSVLPAPGNAEPRLTIAQVQARVDALNAKVDDANELYAASKLDLKAATRRAAVAEGRVRAAQAELSAVQDQMGAVAAAAYRSGGADQFVQLVTTSTPQTFLDRASSLNRIAAGQSAKMALAATARHRLADVQAQAAHEKAAQAAVTKDMAKQQATIESALAEQTRLLSSLKADEKAKLDRARRAAAARASAEARASRSRSVTSYPTYNGPASGRAAVAVQEAYAKLGSPYQWAATGPSRFDCSGLTMWVWAKAGVSLPHSSRAQYASGNHVSRGDLQPGDLTFYGSPIHHVGIYIGGGRMISAPHTGDVVKIQNAFRGDYAGAVRP
jgi:cell wall-associated NlpC family hydrolase